MAYEKNRVKMQKHLQVNNSMMQNYHFNECNLKVATGVRFI